MNKSFWPKRPLASALHLVIALAVAASTPVAARTAAAVVADYLEAMTRKDRRAVEALLADDVVFEYPFDRSGRTDAGSWRVFNGREAVMSGYVDVAFQRITMIRFVDREMTPSTDGSRVFVEALGDMALGEKPYRNRYVLRFDLRRDRIVRMKEYFNPVTAAVAAGVTTGAEEPPR